MKSLCRQSGCKINLLLNILGKRPDGFHELETVMQPVPLFDELEITIGGASLELTCDLQTLPCDDSNLIVKAARAFFRAARIPPSARIRLNKRIPMEAGLGGGSGNAATALSGLNELFDRPLNDDELTEAAAALGSDVPFFLQSSPALATGRGERIEPLPPFPALNGLTLVLIHPGFGISTAWAYQSLARIPNALNGRPGRARELIGHLQEGQDGHRQWGRELYNSLEAPAFGKHPVLELYIRSLCDSGATGALMSGSGSTVFAWFDSNQQAGRALETFRSKFGSAFWSAVVG